MIEIHPIASKFELDLIIMHLYVLYMNSNQLRYVYFYEERFE